MKKTAIFIALSIVTLVSVSMLITNYSDNVKYDSNKVHHGKNSFKTKRSASIFQWLSMRFKQGPTPSVAQRDIEFILAEVELSQIDLRSASSEVFTTCNVDCTCYFFSKISINSFVKIISYSLGNFSNNA